MVFFAFDFDETLTQKDTLALIIKCTNEVELNNLIWKRLSQRYCNLASTGRDEFFKTHENPILEDYCEFFRSIEMDSIEHIEESKCYDEISKVSLFNMGKTQAKLHGEAISFLSQILKNNLPVTIISANFSQDIIKGAISNIPYNDSINVYSNDLEFGDNNLTTGNIITNYVVANDKLKLLNSICNNNKIIYVGDGLTDILCMLKADVGIVYSPGRSFIQDCKEFNVILKPLASWTEQDLNLSENNKTIYFVLNWNDIINWWDKNKEIFI